MFGRIQPFRGEEAKEIYKTTRKNNLQKKGAFLVGPRGEIHIEGRSAGEGLKKKKCPQGTTQKKNSRRISGTVCRQMAGAYWRLDKKDRVLGELGGPGIAEKKQSPTGLVKIKWDTKVLLGRSFWKDFPAE